MGPRNFLTIATSVMAALGCGSPLMAQILEMNAEDITRAFENQKTRGLTMLPAPGTEAAAPAAAPGTTLVSPEAPEPKAPATAALPPTEGQTTTYQAVAPQDQVNIQITFGFDSALMNDDQKPKLDTMCEVMKTVDVGVFQIIGHTDAAGPADYNESLSLLRAQEVERHLVTECGIDKTRLQAVGMGEKALIDQADPEGDENRRVEFQALV